MDGRRVRLIGTYAAVPTLKKMPRPGRPAEEVDLGEVVIVLDPGGEGARVALGTDARSPDEIAEFDGRRVEVEGRLVLEPSSGSEGAAPRAGPALESPTGPRLAGR